MVVGSRGDSPSQKFTFKIALLSTLAFVLATIGFLTYGFISTRASLTQSTSDKADRIADKTAAAFASGGFRAAQDTLGTLETIGGIAQAQLRDPSGRVFASFTARHRNPDSLLLKMLPAVVTQSPPVVHSYSIYVNDNYAGSASFIFDFSAHRQRTVRSVIVFLPISAILGLLLAQVFQKLLSLQLLALLKQLHGFSALRDSPDHEKSGVQKGFGDLLQNLTETLTQVQKRDDELNQKRAQLEKEILLREAINGELSKAKEAAEAASRTKSEFLANMSHEIRTPMNGIIGMTELALETSLTEEQKEYLGTVKLSAEALLSIINDILDFSKIEAGRMEVESIDFNIDELLGDTLKGLALSAHRKGLELAYDLQADVPEGLVGDAHRIRQVLINLIGNAIKFTSKGEVIISVSADPQNGPNNVHFEVRDTGIGIPETKRQTIFEAFGQADSSQSRKYGGTGLGLTISSRLAKLMGGRLWVESQEGVGSCFHFTVPLQPSPHVQHTSVEPLKGIRALIVDDHSTNRKILRSILSHWEMEPSSVSSGPAGLTALTQAAASSTPYQVALIDGHMPGMDGFELAEQIRLNPNLRDTAVVILTSGGQGGDIERCQRLGLSGYLIKPLRRSELLSIIFRSVQIQSSRSEIVKQSNESSSDGKLRLLLAEDNPVNQKIAIRLLERAGHFVTLAEDGRAAVQAAASQPFDIILMDIQMPHMDGYEATAAIRSLGTNRNTPIIAMTAHAMAGDREKCLAAGMDGYVAKPIRKQELFNALAAVSGQLSTQVPGSPETGSAELASDSQIEEIIREQVLERTGGDMELLGQLCELFLQQCPELIRDLQAAVVKNDAIQVERIAHKLKGSVSLFGVKTATDAVLLLEKLGAEGRVEAFEKAFHDLNPKLENLQDQLRKMEAETKVLLQKQ